MEGTQDRWTKVSWTPVYQCVLLFGGAFICYLVALINGDVTIYIPFISETAADVPERNIFSFCVIFGSYLGIIIVCYRYLVLKYMLVNEHAKLQKLNGIACFLGIVSWCGCAGVAAFPMSSVLWVHLLSSITHFILALLYVLLQTFINYHVRGSSLFWNRLRLVICLLLMLFLFLLVIFFPLSFFKWRKVNSHAPAKKVPEDPVFGIMISSSIFEWAVYGTLLAYLMTFMYEFRSYHLVIGVVPVQSKVDSDS